MSDSKTFDMVFPALSIGYAVKNDPDGKFRFWNDTSTIRFDAYMGWWELEDSTGEVYPYAELKEALKQGAD